MHQGGEGGGIVEDRDYRGRHPALFLERWMRRQKQGGAEGRLAVGRLVVVSVTPAG